jgi:hypothetical protein
VVQSIGVHRITFLLFFFSHSIVHIGQAARANILPTLLLKCGKRKASRTPILVNSQIPLGSTDRISGQVNLYVGGTATLHGQHSGSHATEPAKSRRQHIRTREAVGVPSASKERMRGH